MRILLITGSYPPMRCGVGDYSERLAHALSNYADIGVDVLTSAMDSAPAIQQRPAVHFEMRSWAKAGVLDFLKVMRRVRPQLVHIQFPTQGYVRAVGALEWIPFLCRYLFRVPVVQTWHEYVPDREPNILRCMYAMARGADALVVVRPDYATKIPPLMRRALRNTPIRFIENISNIPTVRLTDAQRQDIRRRLATGSSRLVAHFGFVYAHKGTDLLFQIADPERDHLLFIGELLAEDSYHARILQAAASPRWQGKVTVTGFVGHAEAAELLAAADAVIFPYVNGGGVWNSAMHAATSQGTFVIATSSTQEGYDAARNTYWAKPGDLEEMKRALALYSGTRQPDALDAQASWRQLASAHRAVYESLT